MKACAHPCCPAFVMRGARYCAKHAGQYAQSLAERERLRMQRVGTATERGYGERWKRYRRYFLACHPVCACGCGGASTDVDHIVAVTGPNDPLFWEQSNHQALTHACHTRKTIKQDGGFGNVRK